MIIAPAAPIGATLIREGKVSSSIVSTTWTVSGLVEKYTDKAITRIATNDRPRVTQIFRERLHLVAGVSSSSWKLDFDVPKLNPLEEADTSTFQLSLIILR